NGGGSETGSWSPPAKVGFHCVGWLLLSFGKAPLGWRTAIRLAFSPRASQHSTSGLPSLVLLVCNLIGRTSSANKALRNLACQSPAHSTVSVLTPRSISSWVDRSPI